MDFLGEIEAAIAANPEAPVAEMRALRRGFSKRLAQAPGEEVLGLARKLLSDPGPWRRFFAYELVQNHAGAAKALNPRLLEELGQTMQSWEAVDTFSCYLSGQAWRNGQIDDRVIAGWAQSPNRWWRRAALVSTIPLNMKSQGGAGDTPRTLAVCEMLANDRDDMVVKALSWALRALGTRDPVAVQAFLDKHGSALAGRVRREVGHKLTHGLKNPRRDKEKQGAN